MMSGTVCPESFVKRCFMKVCIFSFFVEPAFAEQTGGYPKNGVVLVVTYVSSFFLPSFNNC